MPPNICRLANILLEIDIINVSVSKLVFSSVKPKNVCTDFWVYYGNYKTNILWLLRANSTYTKPCGPVVWSIASRPKNRGFGSRLQLCLKIYVGNYILNSPRALRSRITLSRDQHKPAKQLNGVCEVPNTDWPARELGLSPLTLKRGLSPAVGLFRLGWFSIVLILLYVLLYFKLYTWNKNQWTPGEIWNT